MPNPLRLAVVGIDHPHGFAWRETLRAQGPDAAEIVAVVPRFGGAIASLEESLADLPRFDRVEGLLAADLAFDGALVCLPNDETPGAVAALARAGKALLVEKPIARTAAEARPALEAVEAAGVAFQGGYVWRYDAMADRLRAMVADGRFGKLIHVEMNFVTSDARRRGADHWLFDPAASGGGFFHWLGCHWLDLLLYVTDRAVVGVTARTGVYGASELAVEDGGAAILELEGGGMATLTGGYWLPRWAGASRWSLHGTERWVQWEPARPGTGGALEIHGPKPQWDAMDETFALPPDVAPGYGGSKGIAAVADWLAAARSGGGPRAGRNTTASAAAVLTLLDLIGQSSREGRRLECRVGPA
jgi:predicted dehydrogenase